MEYALVDPSGVLKYADFTDPPPALSTAKTLKWYPVVNVTEPQNSEFFVRASTVLQDHVSRGFVLTH